MENNNIQIVLVMDELDAINFYKKGYAEPGCKVIPFNSESLDLQNPIIAQVKKDNLLVQKNVLIKSPYSSTFYSLEEASEKIHADYFRQFSSVLGALGAKKVSVKECNVVDSTSSWHASGSVEVPAGLGGDVTMNRNIDKHKKALLELSEEFTPSFDIAKAKELIKEYSLENDRSLTERIIAIEKGGVKTEKLQFNIEISKKLKSTFDLAANIKPYAGIDIKAKFDTNKDITETYSLNIEAEFDTSLMG